MSIFRVHIQPTLQCYSEKEARKSLIPFIFFTVLTIFILFKEKMTTLTLKLHKAFDIVKKNSINHKDSIA